MRHLEILEPQEEGSCRKDAAAKYDRRAELRRRCRMRLFFDSNILTYIAFFEGFMVEGDGELSGAVASWTALQPHAPDENVIREARALRALYVVDDRARFDFLLSDLGLTEVLAIRNEAKRAVHYDLLDRMIEHRNDIYAEEMRADLPVQREALFAGWAAMLPAAMHKDGRQYAESSVVESIYFLTNDMEFIKRTSRLDSAVTACRPSDLPFLGGHTRWK